MNQEQQQQQQQQQARIAMEKILKTATEFLDATSAVHSPQVAAVVAPLAMANTVHSLGPIEGKADAQTARVVVRRPDGTPTTIPAIHLKAALEHGYKQS